ncbi:MAG: pyruvate ferredoxin oxidoreductase [bacterium]|nr:pyruvate ferredoxin oxidoreductase [bacterium]
MGKPVAMTGNIAVANAMRQINPDVCAAYPITPSTEVMQQFASFVADGKVDTELVTAESEHSAMSACIGAAAAGGRVMTATSANGLALMWEMLYIASGNRLPIVMTVVNRALSAPINIHGDHSDGMGARDSGWIQIYSENAQEAYDNLIQAVVIGQHRDVRLPVMVGMDGFIISHSIENLELLSDQEVKDFIGEYLPLYPLLNIKQPVTYGPLDLQDYYSEHKRQQAEAMKLAKPVILKVAQDFAALSGRKYGFFETYRLDDAEMAILTLGSSAGTARFVIDRAREQGVKVGLIKLRVFRPFPMKELQAALGHLKALAVMDRCDSFGAAGGPVFSEVRSALYDLSPHPAVVNYIYGLGGRDLGIAHIEQVIRDLQEIRQTGCIRELLTYLTVRE